MMDGRRGDLLDIVLALVPYVSTLCSRWEEEFNSKKADRFQDLYVIAGSIMHVLRWEGGGTATEEVGHRQRQMHLEMPVQLLKH